MPNGLKSTDRAERLRKFCAVEQSLDALKKSDRSLEGQMLVAKSRVQMTAEYAVVVIVDADYKGIIGTSPRLVVHYTIPILYIHKKNTTSWLYFGYISYI